MFFFCLGTFYQETFQWNLDLLYVHNLTKFHILTFISYRVLEYILLNLHV